MKKIDIKGRLKLLEVRSGMYGFLAEIYKSELQCPQLERIVALDFDLFVDRDDDSTLIDEGFDILSKFVQSVNSSTLLNLARDYARTFLAAGLGERRGAYPYESVYTSPDRLIMQESRDEVMKFYETEQLATLEGITEPEDHIAFEFEFMSYLCEKEMRAIEAEDDLKREEYGNKQHDFFTKHINVWADRFCDDVLRVSREPFYKGVATITKGLLEAEREAFEV